jgi:hypothetical protein
MTDKQSFYGWKLVGVLFLQDFLNMGFPLYGGTVINTYMLKEIAMSRSAFGLGFTLLSLLVRIPSTLVAASILRWGVRRTFGIGSAVILGGRAVACAGGIACQFPFFFFTAHWLLHLRGAGIAAGDAA